MTLNFPYACFQAFNPHFLSKRERVSVASSTSKFVVIEATNLSASSGSTSSGSFTVLRKTFEKGKSFLIHRLVKEIASGSYGTVYQAQHIIFDDRPLVALKLLYTAFRSPKDRAQFIQEAQVLNKLKHQHILRILDAGFHNTVPYLVTDYASGGSKVDPNDALACVGKGNALKRYEEAIVAYDQAIKLNPNSATAYYNKGNVLSWLRRYQEALVTYEQAIRLDPTSSLAYIGKGNALNELQRYEEALVALEQATKLNPHDAIAHHNKGVTLQAMKRNKEANLCFDKAKQLGLSN